MTPLDLRVAMGLEDARLLLHIEKLESFGALSEGERRTLYFCYSRLDAITSPKPKEIQC